MTTAELLISQACREVIAAIRVGRRIGHAASMWACAKEPWRCRRFGHRYPLYWGQLSDVERLPEWRCLRRRCPDRGDATDALWAVDEAAS